MPPGLCLEAFLHGHNWGGGRGMLLATSGERAGMLLNMQSPPKAMNDLPRMPTGLPQRDPVCGGRQVFGPRCFGQVVVSFQVKLLVQRLTVRICLDCCESQEFY